MFIAASSAKVGRGVCVSARDLVLLGWCLVLGEGCESEGSGRVDRTNLLRSTSSWTVAALGAAIAKVYMRQKRVVEYDLKS